MRVRTRSKSQSTIISVEYFPKSKKTMESLLSQNSSQNPVYKLPPAQIVLSLNLKNSLACSNIECFTAFLTI